MTTLLALIGLHILGALIIFQIALILGAPIGKYAWGGQHRQLPAKLRIASVTSIALYLLFGLFLASKAGLMSIISSQNIIVIGMWIFTAYFFLGIFVNAISRSKSERAVMTPVAGVLALVFLAVTIS